MKIVFEGIASKEEQDGGMAKILHFENEGQVFVKVWSWDRIKEHADLTKLLNGGIIRVTIENVEE